MATYKLFRVKNHYHILGEECKHRGRQRKAHITRSKPQKSLLKGSKAKTRAVGFTLVSWAVFALMYALINPWTVTYAKEAESIDLSQNLSLTPEQQYDVLEAIKVQAFEIRRQLEVHQKFETADEVRNYVLAEAKKAGVHVEKFLYIAEKESQFNPKATGDMHITCPSTGKPVRSRGLFQISTCYHPEVSDAQAYDVQFATGWAINVIANSKKDCITQFSTCRAWHKKMGTL